MSEVRRFDHIERVVRDARRKLNDVESTVLARLATHTHGASGVTDHGALTGLADDDHPQYLTGAAAIAAYQPLDGDLTAIAGLAPADGALMRRVAGAWSTSTLAQVKTDLALTKGDVGLGSVDDVSAAALRDRATHSGAQTQSTVTNLVSDLAGKAPTVHTHVATTDLTATGTKDSTTFLRGDDTWGVPPAGGGVTDHGALTGLGDNDHPQYSLTSHSHDPYSCNTVGTGNVSAPHATWTGVSLSVSLPAPSVGWSSTGTYVYPPENGYYLIAGAIYMQGTGGSILASRLVTVSSGPLNNSQSNTSASSNATVWITPFITFLTTSNGIRAEVYQNSGGTRSTLAAQTCVSITRVGTS